MRQAPRADAPATAEATPAVPRAAAVAVPAAPGRDAGLGRGTAGTPAAPPAGAAARLLAVQRLAGNAAVTALVTGGPRRPAPVAVPYRPAPVAALPPPATAAPRAASPTEIAHVEGAAPAGSLVTRAGTPAAQAPPSGVQLIAGRRTVPTLGTTAGLTLIQHSGAFTPPQWLPDARPRREGNGTLWTPTVAPTQATDVTHDSLFVGAGDHDMFPAASNTEVIGGRTYRHVLRVTQDQSTLVQRGEQEHLDDAALAFALTYAAVAAAINQVAALTLAARPSREEAIAALTAELDARLPGLGTNPGGWPAILDRLLTASSQRDVSWHNAGTGTRRREQSTGLIVWPLDTGGLNIGVPSSQLVHL